jgi:glycosyltransferase involved in cell wall biosynthesis
MNKITVLVTSPSIDGAQNVSGIANMTNLWLENNKEVNYVIFEAGKKDKTKRNFLWLLIQPLILINFFKKIFNDKNIDIVHINMPLEKLAIIRESFFLFIASIFNKPVLLHIRGGLYNHNDNIPRIFKYLINHSFSKAYKIIVLGERESLFFKRTYSISASKIVVLPNCVNMPCISQEIKLHSKLDCNMPLNILFLGRLDRNKGLEEIIKSLASLPSQINFILNIAGDGPDKDWFLEECKSKLPNQFLYCGVVSGMAKTNLYNTSHIFLLPSYYEGLPNALLEAMSYGLIPIVTAVGSIPDVISNDENGIIIPLKNHQSIRDSIIKLDKDSLLFENLSKNAQKTIRDHYSLDRHLISMNQLYEELFRIKTL